MHNFKALTEISNGNYQNTFNKNCTSLQANNPYRGIKGTHNAQKGMTTNRPERNNVRVANVAVEKQ